MKRFRMDNTEGYEQEDLNKLNKIFERTLKDRQLDADDINYKSAVDHIEAMVMTEYDQGSVTE